VIAASVVQNYLSATLERIRLSPIAYRLAHGFFWTIAGSVVARGLNLLSSIPIARVLGKSGFGEYGIIMSTVGMFGTFAGFGLGMTATKYISEFRNVAPERAGRIRALSSVTAWITTAISCSLMYLFTPWLASTTLGAPQLVGSIRLSCLLLFITSINGAQVGMLNGFEAFKTISKINMFCGVINLPALIAGVYLGGLRGVIWALIVVTSINWWINHIAVKKECLRLNIPYNYSNIYQERAILFNFSLPAMLSNMLMAPAEWMLNAMLVTAPNGFAQMGIYNAAKQWNSIILYIPNSFANITLPVLSNSIGEKKYKQYMKLITVNSVMLFGVALLFALPISIMSRYIMGFYGQDFQDGNMVLIAICAYSVLYSANIVIGQILWTVNMSRLAFILSAVRAALLIVIFRYFTQKTAYGLALAFVVTYLLQTIYQYAISKWAINKIFVMHREAG
jgi:O-antigen/teichoic acid export membrane protein